MGKDIETGRTEGIEPIKRVLTYLLFLKSGQNRKGQKVFYLHRFLNPFSQLPAVKKDSKNGAAGKCFGPSYFVTALVAHFLYPNKMFQNCFVVKQFPKKILSGKEKVLLKMLSLSV
jgi:hypothetical protein